MGEPTRRDWIAVMSAMLGAFMAVFDTQTLLKERFESIESDLWSLEKP